MWNGFDYFYEAQRIKNGTFPQVKENTKVYEMKTFNLTKAAALQQIFKLTPELMATMSIK